MLIRSQRRIAGWLAVAAVALQFLAPLVSQALATWKGTPEGWEHICSIQAGSRVSPSEAPTSPTQDDPNAAPGHCPFCLLHHAHWAPAAQLTPVIVELGGEPPAPTYGAVAAQSRHFWQSPQSRAPPALS